MAWTCRRCTHPYLHALGRSFIEFRFGGEADNILFYANEAQKEEFLIPTIEGDRDLCFAITEPNAGSDAANIKMSARRDGDDWILNGEKIFITGGNDADFAIVVAVTDPLSGPAAAQPLSWSTARWAGRSSSSRPWARAVRPRWSSTTSGSPAQRAG